MMRKYKQMTLAIALILCLLLTSCSFFTKKEPEPVPEDEAPTVQQAEDENLRQTVFYYQDNTGYLIPVMRKIPWVEGIGKATLSELVSTEENMKEAQELALKTIIPDGTQVDLSINEGLAKVKLSKEALSCEDAVAETNMVSGIVNTLTEFPAVEKVQIQIEGNTSKKLKFGTDISKPFDKMNLNVETADKTVNAKEASKLILFFENETGNYLVPVTRLSSQKASLEAVLKELMEGPAEGSKLVSSLPENTELLSVVLTDGVAVVNFSEEFDALAESSENERLFIKAVMLSCKQFPEVKDVKIQVEGKDYVPGNTANLTVPTFVNEY